MEPFLTQNIVEPIMEFIKTCPFLDEYKIDLTPASFGRLVTDKPDGSTLDYVGSVLLQDGHDTNGRRFTSRQASFQLWLLRKSNHNIYRKEIADFLFNFEQWIEYCQAYNLTPKISKSNNGKISETMSADNGVYFADWEGEESSLYMVQLHINYYNEYLEVF